MPQSQNKAHAQAVRKNQQHAIKIFLNKIKTGFSEFFGEAFDDAPPLRKAFEQTQNEPDLLTQAGNLIVNSVSGDDESPSDNASFNQNAAFTA